MIRTRETGHIDLPPEAVVRLFLDYPDWPALFPATIREVTLVSRDKGRLVIDVQHREGLVRNVVTVCSPGEVVVEEWKRRYRARFTYRFLEHGEGTRLILEGEIALSWPWAVLEPVVTPWVRRQMRKLVIEPLQRAAALTTGAWRFAP